jgi:hypothetical protein
MKKLRRKIPDFFINKRNTVIQIIFTTVFAFVFINIYKPFGSQHWYNATQLQFFLFSGLLVLQGMLVVLLSRIVLFQVKKHRAITIRSYALMVVLEIIVMAAFYATYEKLIINDSRSFLMLWYVAGGNTSLILLCPYLISSLYFAWDDKKRYLEKLLLGETSAASIPFISFYDEKDALKLTIQTTNLFYIESSDNYVTIYYADGNTTKKYLLRNSLKRMEEMLCKYPVIRCHRSFMVNINQIKMVRKGKKGYEIEMNMPDHRVLPVTKTYEPEVLGCFHPRQKWRVK